MGCVLEINNLTKKYSAFELKSISFQIKAGEVMGFIGRNGAGKTTALKSILNLVHPDAGNVRILGMDYPDNEDEIKQQIGYVVGGTNYYKRKKLKDIVAITRIFYDNWDDESYRHYLDAFKLDENKKIMELSEGMKVKFYLTLALSHQARLLILDEPVAGLDPKAQTELYDLIDRLNQELKITIIMVSHDVKEVVQRAKHILHLAHKQLFFGEAKKYRESELGKSFVKDLEG
mgnify:FL=1